MTAKNPEVSPLCDRRPINQLPITPHFGELHRLAPPRRASTARRAPPDRVKSGSPPPTYCWGCSQVVALLAYPRSRKAR